MNNGQITKAPWLWYESGKDDWLLWGNHGHRPIILDVGSLRGTTKRRLRCRDATNDLMVPFDPTHPDMRLIKASPKLLAACQSALALLDPNSPEVKTRMTVYAQLEEAIKEATE